MVFFLYCFLFRMCIFQAGLDSQQNDSKGSLTSLTSDELSKIEDDNSISLPAPASLGASPAVNTNTSLLRSQSNQSLQSITKELFDSGMQDAKSLTDEPGTVRLSPDRSFQVPNLTEAQQKAITGKAAVVAFYVIEIRKSVCQSVIHSSFKCLFSL